jgi:hypothetical protein
MVRYHRDLYIAIVLLQWLHCTVDHEPGGLLDLGPDREVTATITSVAAAPALGSAGAHSRSPPDLQTLRARMRASFIAPRRRGNR